MLQERAAFSGKAQLLACGCVFSSSRRPQQAGIMSPAVVAEYSPFQVAEIRGSCFARALPCSQRAL
eukprot:4747012-Amphidinium_carterae.1